MANNKLQGEGDRESARRFNNDAKEFLHTEQGRKSKTKSDHTGKYSTDELKKAEKQAARKAQETDPEASRDFSKPAK